MHKEFTFRIDMANDIHDKEKLAPYLEDLIQKDYRLLE